MCRLKFDQRKPVSVFARFNYLFEQFTEVYLP